MSYKRTSHGWLLYFGHYNSQSLLFSLLAVFVRRAEASMASVYIPVQNSEEEVRVSLDQLPRDANDILDILKAEQAPLDLWLIIAVICFLIFFSFPSFCIFRKLNCIFFFVFLLLVFRESISSKGSMSSSDRFWRKDRVPVIIIFILFNYSIFYSLNT